MRKILASDDITQWNAGTLNAHYIMKAVNVSLMEHQGKEFISKRAQTIQTYVFCCGKSTILDYTIANTHCWALDSIPLGVYLLNRNVEYRISQ